MLPTNSATESLYNAMMPAYPWIALVGPLIIGWYYTVSDMSLLTLSPYDHIYKLNKIVVKYYI